MEVVSAIAIFGKKKNMNHNSLSIHDEIINGNEHQVNQLIKNGADIDSYDQLHWSPLHLAIRLGKINIVKLLLKENANTETKTLGNLTPLHFAVKLQDIEIVKIILEHGANVNAQDDMGQSPLSALLEENNNVGEVRKTKISKILRLLLDHGAEHQSNQILNYGSSNSLTDFVNYYMKMHIGANCEKTKQLMWSAICEKSEEVFQILLTHANNQMLFNAQNLVTPFIWAIAEKCEDIVKCLILQGIDVNLAPEESPHPNLIPINLSVHRGFLKISQCLLQNGAIVNLTTCTPPIFFAIQNRSNDMLKLLINYGADTNIVDIDSTDTPLVFALKLKEWAIVKLLIVHGAKTNHDCIFIAISKRCNHIELLEILIMNGSDVNFKSPTDLKTPLHLACQYGLSNAVQILLENGANINDKDSQNKTPLEYAMIHNHQGVYKIIVTFMMMLHDELSIGIS